MYDTIDKILSSDADVVFGTPDNTIADYIALTLPYLKSETVLYLNSSVDPGELENKKYAAVKDNKLPKGIREENVVYFKTRETCMDAVESGRADYGFGNAYSVAFYTLQNHYKNIITIPETQEVRAYCIGAFHQDETLLSILNKAISAMDESHMRTLILNEATRIEMKVTIPMILDTYGIQIIGIILALMTISFISFLHNVRAKNEIKIQVERYQRLSQTSNEYLYEYHVKTKRLELSQSCIELFGDIQHLSDLTAAFHKVLVTHKSTIPSIELPVASGERRFFKSVNSLLYDDKGKVFSIIGKLIDINEEEMEKKKLIEKSEMDGLTGIYNVVTIKSLVARYIKNASPDDEDALIVIDCDKFKEINDSYGHLQGDRVLINLGRAMTRTFRKTDVIGRMGGDEFCIYMREIPSPDFVASKCRDFMVLAGEWNKDYNVTVSIGIALRGDEKSYDDLFKKADQALYDAKRNGGNQIRFFGQEESRDPGV